MSAAALRKRYVLGPACAAITVRSGMQTPQKMRPQPSMHSTALDLHVVRLARHDRRDRDALLRELGDDVVDLRLQVALVLVEARIAC